MRIISQDGTIDIPYEQATVMVNGRNTKEVVARGMEAVSSSLLLMAEYSTEEQAIEAMMDLRKQYCNCKHEETYIRDYKDYNPVFMFPKDKERHM